MTFINTLADPGGGAHPAHAPPNGRGPMIFLCPKRKNFPIFFSLDSLAIRFRPNFIMNMAKNRLKMTFYFNPQHFQWCSTPRWQSPRPPLRSNPGSATDTIISNLNLCIIYIESCLLWFLLKTIILSYTTYSGTWIFWTTRLHI